MLGYHQWHPHILLLMCAESGRWEAGYNPILLKPRIQTRSERCGKSGPIFVATESIDAQLIIEVILWYLFICLPFRSYSMRYTEIVDHNSEDINTNTWPQSSLFMLLLLMMMLLMLLLFSVDIVVVGVVVVVYFCTLMWHELCLYFPYYSSPHRWPPICSNS